MEPAYLLDYTLNHANLCTHGIFNFGMAAQIACIVKEMAQWAIVLHHFVLRLLSSSQFDTDSSQKIFPSSNEARIWFFLK